MKMHHGAHRDGPLRPEIVRCGKTTRMPNCNFRRTPDFHHGTPPKWVGVPSKTHSPCCTAQLLQNDQAVRVGIFDGFLGF